MGDVIKKWWFWLIVAFVILGVFAPREDTENTNTPTDVITQNEPEIVTEQKNIETESITEEIIDEPENENINSTILSQTDIESSQETDNSSTVYIAASGKGERYHKKSTCIKNSKTINKNDAERFGYTPCKKCAQ